MNTPLNQISTSLNEYDLFIAAFDNTLTPAEQMYALKTQKRSLHTYSIPHKVSTYDLTGRLIKTSTLTSRSVLGIQNLGTNKTNLSTQITVQRNGKL